MNQKGTYCFVLILLAVLGWPVAASADRCDDIVKEELDRHHTPSEFLNYFDRGIDYENAGNFQMAIDAYTAAINLVEDSWAYSYRGQVKEKTGDHEGALADYSRAIELNPCNGDYYSDRAKIKKELGDVAGAQEDEEMVNKLLDEEYGL